MLNKLTVQNFAIISNLTLQFGPGLNVFSGETGAGKSIVIEALGFVLGARGDADAIKDGAQKMTVSAEFSTDMLPEAVRRERQLTGETFTLKRELDRNGKGKAFINGKPVTVSALAQIGRYLVDFHGQHEHQSLMHPSVHLTLLDKFSKQETLLQKVHDAYTRLKNIEERLNAAALSEQEKERLRDLCAYQLKEIEDVNPTADEDLELEQNLPKMKNAGRLLELAQTAYSELYEEEGSATERAGKAARCVEDMAQLDENAAELAENLNSALAALEDAASSLAAYKDDINLDPQALDDMLSRHEKIKRLKSKYGPGIEDVLKTAQDLKQRLHALDHQNEEEELLRKEWDKQHAELLRLSQQMHDKRMQAAEKLSQLLCEQIRPLGFNAVRFRASVEMDEENLGPTGADKVEFLFSPNPGQALRPLKNIASGGEISRVMLGLKTVLAPTVPVMVFDEVDAGIGGETAHLVGEKLKAVSKGRQVLCVTHLAQVAAQADENFHVAKSAKKDSTEVSITPLTGEKLTAEIARMLGGNADPKSAAYTHAQELLKQAGRKNENK